MPKYLGMSYMQFQTVAWVVFFILLGLSFFWGGFFWMAVAVLLTKMWVGPSLLSMIEDLLAERRRRR
jgi:hypothetical protein